MRPIPTTPNSARRAYFIALLRSHGRLFEALRLEMAEIFVHSPGYAAQMADYWASGRNE